MNILGNYILCEYSYRWNTRDLTEGERFEDWFSHINGKRLPYQYHTSKKS